jgi:hypothetical protein
MANTTIFLRGPLGPVPILVIDNLDGTYSLGTSSAGGSADPATIAGPLGRAADAASVSVALSTEDAALFSPLLAVGSSLTVTPAITVDTAVYAAGDTVGGIITILNAFRASGKEAILQSIHILDRSNQKPTGNLLFFNASPAAATTTDNAAFVYSTDDLKEVARVPIAATDYVTINSKAVANLSNLGRQVYATAGTSLFVVFVTDGAPDFVATTDLQISYSFLRD